MKKQIKIFGLSVPSYFIYIAIVIVIFISYKLFAVVSGFFDMIMIKLGIKKETDPNQMSSDDLNSYNINKSLSNDPSVKSQMTVGNMTKADQIYNAIDGFGYNFQTVLTVFKSISGPNQMKAIYLSFGTRTLTIGFIPYSKGDLIKLLKFRLKQSEFNQISNKLNLIK